MRQYRCTRPNQYPQGSPGYDNPEERQGYYIPANNLIDAQNQMRQRFPNDTKFECVIWN
jgi:hypothetical protein